MAPTVSTSQYGQNPRQIYARYDNLTFKETKPIIFIHGGAWRDPRNTFNDADELFHFVAAAPKVAPLYTIDYRLTPEVKYPEHNNDVFVAIETLLKEESKEGRSFSKLNLVGHSVGATIILGILEKVKELADQVEVFLIDGIYDLKELVAEYPDYEGFVTDAHDDYKSLKPTDFSKHRDVLFNVIHSKSDELLSTRQTNWLVKQLKDNDVNYRLEIGEFGTHEEVYRNEQVAKFIGSHYLN